MNPTGWFEHGDLVLERHIPRPIDDVWAAITESDRLERWYGTWTGDPASGSVMVTMNSEGDEYPAVEYTIRACEPPRRLSLSATDDFGDWRLVIELDEHDGGTSLRFRQEDLDPDAVRAVGPGWEWYLDRMVASLTAATLPDFAEFEGPYMDMGGAYVELHAGLGGPASGQ